MSLTALHVSHRYERNGPLILDDVTMTLRSGSTTALMGPSGSGKSTLLAILGGLLTPSGGTVSLDGSPLRRRPDPNTFAWVFQTVNVLNRRTATDNTLIPLLAMGWRRQEAATRTGELFNAVGLSHRIYSPANSLSGGELQRLCIVRALATQPRFVLADEPTGQLDRRTTDVVLDALWAARSPSSTIVIATHDPIVAARCERTITLLDGKTT